MVKKKPIRVLQINIGTKFGGVSSMVFNLYKNIDRSRFQFDFVAPTVSSYSVYKDQIKNLGGKIIELNTTGSFITRKIQFFSRFYKLIKKNNYSIVHCNSGSIFFNLQVAMIAKVCGVKKIIVHSHNAGNDSKKRIIFGNIVKWLFPYVATDFIACSKKAAIFMFPKTILKSRNYIVLNNGIDLTKFQFSSVHREEIRKQLELGNQTILLHVGRFVKQKNHSQLIDIFECFHNIDENSILVLVGEGELKPIIESKVREKKLQNNVLFLGLRKDVEKLMSAADVFVLPSLYEGLPVVGVEAQANGLSCCFSTEITGEVDLNNKKNIFIDLTKSPIYWAKKIHDLVGSRKNQNRIRSAELVGEKGYSIEFSTEQLESLYSK